MQPIRENKPAFISVMELLRLSNRIDNRLFFY